jgi:hypothetical protein
MTVFAWTACTAASPVYLANVVEGLIIFNYGSYEPKRWHATLIMWGFILVPLVWNLYCRRLLNVLETIGGICHVIFFIVSITVLAVLARRGSSEFVWNTLTHDVSGWTNPAICRGIGIMTVAFPITSESGRSEILWLRHILTWKYNRF